ncbi:MAG: single-stranded-DNA-specific exonuclease RecJ [bacterium]
MQTQNVAQKTKKRSTKKTTKQSTYLFRQGIKFIWKEKPFDQNVIHSISSTHNLSLPIAHTLYSRGLTNSNDINAFLFSSFEQEVADPTLLKGGKTAIKRIIKAIEDQEKILIFGDYDVDGVSSTALLLVCLAPLGAQINYHLPHRQKEGYGLSKEIVQKAADHNYKLIITVDNGICAHPAADDARAAGMDLIITDHHRPHGTLPHAHAIINPNQAACRYPYKLLAGVGVTFKLMALLYEQKGLQLPEKAYELLTLGTIADVVPLTGENRFWVRHGLGKINKQRSYALSVLTQNSSLNKEKLNSLDIGFMITPQINALGRLDDSREAVRFLVSNDTTHVDQIGKTLKKMNEDRKRIEQSIYNQIEETIQSNHIDLDQESIIMAAHKQWPAGVIGLVAGKLAHNHGRPTFLFHINDDGVAKGSCRSIPEFNVFDALQQCSDLLIQFGGHSFAAGLAINQEKIPELKQRLEHIVKKTVDPEALKPSITLDAHLDLNETNNKLFSDMTNLEPFGNQNPQPTFLIKNVTLLKPPTLLKDKHLKCLLFANGIIKPTIFFNRPDLYQIFATIADKPFDVVAHVMKNEWQGNVSIELQGLDIALL